MTTPLERLGGRRHSPACTQSRDEEWVRALLARKLAKVLAGAGQGTGLSDGRCRYSVELGEDDVGALGPDEGLGIIVVLVDVAVDCGLEVNDGFEDAPPDTAPVRAEKKFSTALSHEAEVGVKWNTHRG